MKIVLFGNGLFASMAWYYLTQDGPLPIAGFTVNEAYMRGDSHQGLPVVPFETVQQHFPPTDHVMLLPVGPLQGNGLRGEKAAAAKDKGYALTSYVSPRAIVPANLELRENTMVFEGSVVRPFASLGRNVIVNGGEISHHVIVHDDCFIAAGARIGGGAVIGARTFIGLNATVFNNIEVAADCTIAAGAVLTKSVSQPGTYMGVPARRR